MASWLWAVPPENYPAYVQTDTFALRRVGRPALAAVQPGDQVFAYLSGLKVIAGHFEAVGTTFEDHTPLVPGLTLPHRLRVRALVTLPEEEWVPYQAFAERLEVATEYPAGFRSVVQQVLHPLPTVDAKVLAFLVRARQAADLEQLFTAYDAYLQAKAEPAETPTVQEAAAAYQLPASFDRAEALETLITALETQGFVYEPWQVAAYTTALRTKPFVILAGVTGTGKSKLPALVAEATGGAAHLIPVRPDWTDPAEALGYVDLQGRLRPGAVLRAARAAQQRPDRAHVALLDEMNVARVEHYFAEILSYLEDRRPAPTGGYESAPLWTGPLAAAEASWGTVRLGANLALVGTVNMDESTHTFSRKVLDRAFTLELAEVDLRQWGQRTKADAAPKPWPLAAWWPRALGLRDLTDVTAAEQKTLGTVLDALVAGNDLLTPAQAQIAYRTRDEIALFVLHAAATPDAFRTRSGEAVDPLDLALHMKLLPRLLGGSAPLRQAVLGLLGWAATGAPFTEDADAQPLLDAWQAAGYPTALPTAHFPRTTARLVQMWARLLAEGYTSFWV